MDAMETLGLIIEIVFFCLGLYLYLFARGFIRAKDADPEAPSEVFRRENAGWMRIMGLLLAALMLVNIVLRFT